jgi:adenosine deaminase
MFSRALLEALPKTDLHVHLDGSLRLSTLIELAGERGVALPSQTEQGLRDTVFRESYDSLSSYLAGFAYTCAVLQDAEALERVAYELAWDNLNEGVRYVEVRFAPQLHMHGGFGFEGVITAVDRGLRRARSEHEAQCAPGEPGFRYGIIVCALRMFQPGFSAAYRQLCEALSESDKMALYGEAALQLVRAAVRLRDEHGLPIVAFDLAGHEAGFPASHFSGAFDHAHESFLKKTVHAGEAYGAESIYQAISLLHADRIGHGYHLFSADKVGDGVGDKERYCEDLAEYIADRRITIEVCITSNLQTNPDIGGVENHAFQKMLNRNLSATLCTDNRLVSHTTVTREYELATQAFDMTPAQLRNTIIYGFKRSFFPGSYGEKRAYVRTVIDHYEKVWASHNP